MRQIKFLRLKHHLTQSEFAKLIHASQQSVHKYESEECEPPIHILQTICNTFYITLDQLLALTDSTSYNSDVYPNFPSEETILENYRNMNQSNKKIFAELSFKFSRHSF